MSDELTSLITGALEAAESGDDGGGSDASGSVDSGDSGVGTDTGAATSATSGGDAGRGTDSGADAGDAAAAVAADPLTTELEELGLRTPEPGSNNRIPYPRVRKIVENAIAKRDKIHKDALDRVTGDLSTAKQRAEAADAVDNLIATDFPRYLQMIETLHPKAKDAIAAFRTPPKPKEPEKPVVTVEAEPPPFDHKFEDGSLGYTQEGYKKYQQWVLEQAESRAEARADARFEQKYGAQIAPLVTEQRNRALIQQSTQILAGKVEEATQIWGTAFTEEWAKNDKSAFHAYAKEHPKIPFEQVIAAVLVPKLQADRTKMRKEILDEGEVRVAAAAKNVGQGKTPKSESGPVSLDDQIKQAMAEAGLG